MSYKSLLSSVCLIILFVACSVRESWPPKTTGPNLPVRYCDINKEDKDKTIIGYALVDTSAVNWLRVDDGGDGFWRAMLDLEDGIVERLFINGP